jgi:hypothetical protein
MTLADAFVLGEEWRCVSLIVDAVASPVTDTVDDAT